MTDPPARVPCPFVYADGRRCEGHVVRVEAYKAELVWTVGEDGTWSFDFQPRSHYHLFCSAKGNHAGFRRNDPAALKAWYSRLPEELRRVIDATGVQPGPTGP